MIRELRGPSSIRFGDHFTATVKVCNEGTAPAQSPVGPIQVDLYLSTDDTLSWPDPNLPPPTDQVFLATLDVGALEPGDCETRAFTGYAPPPGPQTDGVYYLGAITDVHQALVELDEANNTAVTQLGIGYRPDLVVTEFRGSASTTDSGTVTSTVKVCNQGTELSHHTVVELYLSTNGVLTPPTTGGPPPTNQASLGTVEVAQMPPGHCGIRQSTFPLMQPPDAISGQPLYLGAIADTPQLSLELNEDNNIFVGDVIAVGNGPDLVVTSVQGPTSTRSGDLLGASVRVCNHGTMPAGPSTLELYLSVDDNITVPGSGTPPPPGQALVGQTNVPALNPGHCITRDVQGVATFPAGAPLNGTLFLAAVTDSEQNIPELREDNNVFAQQRIGAGERPDLVVTAIRAPASVAPSPSWAPVNVTVCNEGTVSASQVPVELYLSMVPALDSPATWVLSQGTQIKVGDFSVDHVDAGRCITREAPISLDRPYGAPPWLHAFYVGAVVDASSTVEELREDNNVFVGEQLGVGSGPDLTITAVKGPANVTPGLDVTVSARICNQGNAPSQYTQVELYLAAYGFLNAPAQGGAPSLDPHTAFSIGTHDVPPLGAGECRTLSTVPSVMGVPSEYFNRAFNLGAIVDPHAQVEEVREDNNTFVGDLMGVGSRPDLVVTAVEGPSNVSNSTSFTSTVTVCNQGTYYSPPTLAEVYLSTEPHLVRPDWSGPGTPLPWNQTPVGELNIPTLHVGHCFTGQVTGAPYIPPGSHNESFHLGAIVDVHDAIEELREENNAFARGRIGIGDGADLVVTALSAPASVQLQNTFTASVTVCNQGTGYASSADVELHLSTLPTLEMPRWYGPGHPLPTTQAPIGSISVQHLDAGQCTTQAIQGYTQRPPEATAGQPLYIGAIVDGWGNVEELREDNNTFVKGLMGVGNGPDLVITAVQAPPNAEPHTRFPVTVTVCNQGTEYSDYTIVEVHLSTEEALVMPRWNGPGTPLPPTQQPIGELSVPHLNPGRCFTGSTDALLDPPPAAIPDQKLYLGALVDVHQAMEELREDNNIFLSGNIGVGHASDLVITSLTGPASVEAQTAFTATVTVCNQGTAESYPTELEVHLSTEARMVLPEHYGPGIPIPDSQAYAGGAWVPALGVNDCTTLNVPAWANRPVLSQPEQPLYLGAAINPYPLAGELREDNNTFVGDLMGVGFGPDLVITALQAPVSVEHSGNFTATVTVCNQGTQTSNSTEVDLYFSTQAHVVWPRWSGPGSPYPSTQEFIGSWSVQSLNPGQCVTEAVPAWVNLPQDAEPNHPLYLGAIIDTHRSEEELREDNNTFVSGLMGVGNQPDLVITSVSAPTSVRTGRSFTATVRVCNQGTTSTGGSTDVELYLSSTPTLEFPPQGGPGTPPENQNMIGVVTVPLLDAGQCVSRNTQVMAHTPPNSDTTGFFYLGAIADPWRNLEELREDNNILADRLLMVTP
ncbi:CARDB domain-containing protein [Myxococcus sp. 1LA]